MEMTNLDWCDIKNFKPSEFKYPNKMNPYLIRRLDQFREITGRPVIIHSDYRPNDNGQHGSGDAVDIHVKGMNLLDAYLIAEKCGLFSGIGVYPHWNNAGLHLDIRSGSQARWGCWSKSEPNIYVPLDSAFIRRMCEEGYAG